MFHIGPPLRDTAHCSACVHSVDHMQEPTPTGFNNKGNLLLHVMRDLASGVAGSSAQLIPHESASFYRPINLPQCRHHSFVVQTPQDGQSRFRFTSTNSITLAGR